jgi:SAM-dependent methyltransferase
MTLWNAGRWPAVTPPARRPADQPARPPALHAEYWEERAQLFACSGAGLAAVCSYGMPWFYNAEIHLTQYRALSPHLRLAPGTSVLDVGCGIGRWSRLAARRGARVVGVDLSPTMINEARRRTAHSNCRFVVDDIASFDLGERFDRVVAVTVLQHILEDDRLRDAVANIARHLAPDGRAIILEAAPSRRNGRCDTGVFRARTAEEYSAIFAEAGLTTVAVAGVDPAPFKTMLLPHYRSLPPGLRQAALFAVTAASLPIDVILGRHCATLSWHKVFVLRGERASSPAVIGRPARSLVQFSPSVTLGECGRDGRSPES